MGRENDRSRAARRGSQSTAEGGETSRAPRLLDRIRDEIRIRHYSVSTETTYVQWARRFILFHGKRHPREMGAAEVSAFLTALATRGHVAASTQNPALNARVFLYRRVFGIELGELDAIVRAK